MTGTGDEGDMLSSVVGDAAAVRSAFDQMPVILISLVGPEHQITAANSACRALLGRSDLVGLPVRDVLPDTAQRIFELLDRVYATGRAEAGRRLRVQLDRGLGRADELYLDLKVSPWQSAAGLAGLVAVGTDVTAAVRERQCAQREAARREAGEQQAGAPDQRHRASNDGLAGLQEALLPSALPVLPQARIAARYLVAGQDRSGAGDWFDAIPLAAGRVALIVGDVVGHGIAAAAAMAKLRAVLNQLLAAEPDLVTVLARLNSFAAATPDLLAATVVMAVLDPADGTLHYVTCGHPAPLVIGADGTDTRFLAPTPGGPLGTGSAQVLATEMLRPGDVLLLYSDGLIKRPGRTLAAGQGELAAVAADAAANRLLAANAAPTPAERVSQLTVDLLGRTGFADDVTTLAAERLDAPVPALHLRLHAEVASLTVIRRALRRWLARLGSVGEDQDGVHMAVVETVTNAIEHAYPPGRAGPIEFDLALQADGRLECLITDYGSWRSPDPDAADRGNGLMVAAHMVDQMLISHPAQGDGARPGAAGTIVRLLHRLRHPAMFDSGPTTAAAAFPSWPSLTVDSRIEGPLACAWVRGPVDVATAGEFLRRLLAASRGGTLPLTADLTGVPYLASAGVSALYRLARQLADHGNHLELLAAAGSATQAVLDLVRLPYAAAPPATDAALG